MINKYQIYIVAPPYRMMILSAVNRFYTCDILLGYSYEKKKKHSWIIKDWNL